MSQGLKLSQLQPFTKNNLDAGDLLLVDERVRVGVYTTKRLDASYILRLRTEAGNSGSDEGRVELYKGSNITNRGTTLLNFRGLKAGTNVGLVQESDNIVINATVNGENIESDTTNRVGAYAGKNTSNSNLRFKTFSGEKGISTRSDSNKVFISPKAHHYFFVPANTSDPSVNPTILRRLYGKGPTPIPNADRVVPNVGNIFSSAWD